MNKHCCHIRPQRVCQSERLGSVDVQEVVWEATSEHQRLAQIDEILGASKRPYQGHWERKHVGMYLGL